MASIPDSDGGRWDGDTTWDRAVGPMQFIPTTWRSLGRDGNGDRVADPNNLFDAAVSAAGYLCLGGGGDLSDPARLRQAVYGYNHSWAYVDAVLGWARLYQGGVATGPAVPAGPPAPSITATPPTGPPASDPPGAGPTTTRRPPTTGVGGQPTTTSRRPTTTSPPTTRPPTSTRPPTTTGPPTTGSPTTTTEPCQPTTHHHGRVGHHHDLDHHHDHHAGRLDHHHDPAAVRLGGQDQVASSASSSGRAQARNRSSM